MNKNGGHQENNGKTCHELIDNMTCTAILI